MEEANQNNQNISSDKNGEEPGRLKLKNFEVIESETEEESDYDRANEEAKSVEDKLKELRDQEENSEEPDKTTNCQVSVTQVLTKNDPPPPDTSSHENAGEEYRNAAANVFESIMYLKIVLHGFISRTSNMQTRIM